MLPNLSGLSDGREVPTEGWNEVLPQWAKDHLVKPDTNPNLAWRSYKNQYRRLLRLPELKGVFSWNRYSGPVTITQVQNGYANDDYEARLEKANAYLDARDDIKEFVWKSVTTMMAGSIQQLTIALEDLMQKCESSKENNKMVLAALSRIEKHFIDRSVYGKYSYHIGWMDFLRDVFEKFLWERVPDHLLQLKVLVLKFVMHVLNTADREWDPAQGIMVHELLASLTDEKFDIHWKQEKVERCRPVLELILMQDNYSTPLASELTNRASAIIEKMYQMYHPEVQQWFKEGMREAYGLERDPKRSSDAAAWFKGPTVGKWVADHSFVVRLYIKKKAWKWERERELQEMAHAKAGGYEYRYNPYAQPT